MGRTQGIIARLALAIVALLMVVVATAVASPSMAGPARGHHLDMPAATGPGADVSTEHRHHGEAKQAAERHHVGKRAGKVLIDCPIALEPVHCKICPDRNLLQAAGVRHREPEFLTQSVRFNPAIAGLSIGRDLQTRRAGTLRPPDTPAQKRRPSTPLSLAHRFRI